jgi:hypothetical protein
MGHAWVLTMAAWCQVLLLPPSLEEIFALQAMGLQLGHFNL